MMQTTSHILGYPMPVSLILMSISINPIIFHPIPVSCQDNRLAQTHDEDCLLEAIRVNIAYGILSLWLNTTMQKGVPTGFLPILSSFKSAAVSVEPAALLVSYIWLLIKSPPEEKPETLLVPNSIVY
jgi:hypothetical protein